MWKQLVSLLFSMVIAMAIPGVAMGGTAEWSIKANYAESCSCAPSCPCTYGSKPTLGHCEGTNMIEIEKGHFGGVKLDGIKVVNAFRTGTWVKYYVSDNATEQQVQAVKQLMPAMFGYLKKAEVLDVAKATVTINRTETNLEYSAPATKVNIERMKGYDGGPIKLENIPVHGFPTPAFLDAEQFKSVILSHQGDDKSFKYSGTNGFVAKIDAAGKSKI